jgi:hypothetical protein
MLELARSKGCAPRGPLRQGAPSPPAPLAALPLLRHWPLFPSCPLYPPPSPLLAPLWPFKRPASPHQ